jgi:hypothetical protein
MYIPAYGTENVSHNGSKHNAQKKSSRHRLQKVMHPSAKSTATGRPRSFPTILTAFLCQLTESSSQAFTFLEFFMWKHEGLA